MWDELEKLLAEATPGDWMAPRRTSVLGQGIVSTHQGRMIANAADHDECAANSALIVHLRNNAPAMLAENKRLVKSLMALEVIEDMPTDYALGADENLERARSFARAALNEGKQP
ncbi:MAG: hypothetical protein ACRCYS_16535 [Beijerinckiaceae bacterium]